jgi:hypothetical protein
MKKIFILTCVITLTSIGAFSALPKWKDGDPNVVITNKIEYTKRGSLGTKDHVVTDIETKNLVGVGYNTINSVEVNNDEDTIYDSIGFNVWNQVETYVDTNGFLKVKVPAKDGNNNFIYYEGKKVYVPKAMQLGEYGFQYLNTQDITDIHTFTYTAIGHIQHTTNLGFAYGTNKVYLGSAPVIELPRNDDGSTIQNNHRIFADRAWFTNFIIKAGIKTQSEVETVLKSMDNE